MALLSSRPLFEHWALLPSPCSHANQAMFKHCSCPKNSTERADVPAFSCNDVIKSAGPKQ